MPYTVWSAKSMRFSHGRNRTVFTLSNQSLEHLDLGRVLAQLRLTGCRWAKHHWCVLDCDEAVCPRKADMFSER